MKKEVAIAKVKHARSSFRYFVEEVFSRSEGILKDGKWVSGKFIGELAIWLQEEKQTIRVSARDHFKSMSFYAYIMWLFFKSHDKDIEIQYFSYNAKMASYHINKIKIGILSNPYFDGIIDKKPQAEGVISFSFDGVHRMTVTPRGLLEFKRGIHCPYVFVDDPLQDPENKLLPGKIVRINDIMRTQIIDMFQLELHIAGTPQTNSDFFFDPDFTSRFSVKIMPAILNEKEQKVLWPEWMSWNELMAKKRERGRKVFNQEYLCSPVYSEEAFITPERYDICINPQSINYTFDGYQKDDSDVVGGFDIGKKTHPSHLSVLKKVDRKWKQIHSKWMDNWEYNDQVEYLEEAIKAFGIYVLYYDNTRGEFESIEEQGKLPAEMEPVNFTHKKKYALAGNMDKAITNEEVEFLPESRQRNQLLVVNNDLQAPETKEGHGDSFWSNVLALSERESEGVEATWI